LSNQGGVEIVRRRIFIAALAVAGVLVNVHSPAQATNGYAGVCLTATPTTLDPLLSATPLSGSWVVLGSFNCTLSNGPGTLSITSGTVGGALSCEAGVAQGRLTVSMTAGGSTQNLSVTTVVTNATGVTELDGVSSDFKFAFSGALYPNVQVSTTNPCPSWNGGLVIEDPTIG
jgi:hypothetical protein